jgi:hypothetical protein
MHGIDPYSALDYDIVAGSIGRHNRPSKLVWERSYDMPQNVSEELFKEFNRVYDHPFLSHVRARNAKYEETFLQTERNVEVGLFVAELALAFGASAILVKTFGRAAATILGKAMEELSFGVNSLVNTAAFFVPTYALLQVHAPVDMEEYLRGRNPYSWKVWVDYQSKLAVYALITAAPGGAVFAFRGLKLQKIPLLERAVEGIFMGGK